MLNTIELATLAKAYDLDIFQCIELAKKVDCWSGKKKKIPSSRLDLFEESSRYYAEELINKPNDAIRMMHGAAICWREGEHETTMQNIIQLYQEYLSVDFDGRDWLNLEMKNRAMKLLLPIVRTFFVSQFVVDKLQAVHLLDDNGFSLVQEVRGLSQVTVDKILAAKTATSSLPHTVVPGSASEPPQQPTAESASDAIAAWQDAIEAFKLLPDTRDNSALPRRMSLYLQRLQGASHKKLSATNPNLSRDLDDAKKKDIPKLLEINPNLPLLPELKEN